MRISKRQQAYLGLPSARIPPTHPPFPTPTSRPSTARFSSSSVGTKDIVDTAVAAGSFKTLATALTAAG